MKKCSTCQKKKKETEFYKNRYNKDGLDWECKKCKLGREKKEYAENPKVRERRKETAKRYNKANRGVIYERHNEKYREVVTKLFNLLGNKCANCENTDKRVLQVDHINGDGAKHRKERNYAWWKIYADMIKSVEAGENKYQLLCANCNLVNAVEKGHKKSIWK